MNNKDIKFQMDTSSDVTLINKQTLKKLADQLHERWKKLHKDIN